ncbi:MAG: FAD synthetase family protein [Solibacillus sp.]
MKVMYVNAENLHEYQQDAPHVAMALGYFDGVHLGHQKVIQTATQKAHEQQLLSAVLSFFPHPKSILQPERPVAYLEPIEQKIGKLEKLGVDIFYIVEFTKELSQLTGDVFLADYVAGLQAKEIICGFDYKYGTKSSGDVSTLAAYAKQNGFGFTVVDELKWNKQKISSTLIRHCLNSSQLQEITYLMGGFYQTKYCKQKGLLPNYSLPSQGDYKVLIERDGALAEHYVTVQPANQIFIHNEAKNLPNELTIQWVERV